MNTDIHTILAQKGFIIFKKGESWMMKKILTSEDNRTIEEVPFLTYEGALQEAIKLKDVPISIKWSVIFQFNRGLGPEFKTLDCIDSFPKEVQEIAWQLAEDYCRKTPGMEKAKITGMRTYPIS